MATIPDIVGSVIGGWVAGINTTIGFINGNFNARQLQTFSVADAAALAALSGTYTLAEGDLADQRDTNQRWRYSGSAWVDTSPMEARIIPTAPSGGAGTGVTIASNGRVTLAANTSIKLTCFSSAYSHYRFIGRSTAASVGAGDPIMQYLLGATATTTGYVSAKDQITGSTSTVTAPATSSHNIGRFDATSGGWFDFNVYGPNLAWKTNMAGKGSDSAFFSDFWGYQSDNTQFDGVQFTFTSNTSIILDIYGLNV